jgi:hypothetical protein
MRVVWIDPDRAKECTAKQSDVVRLEYPGLGRELSWSNKEGGLDALVLPRPDADFCIRRPGPGVAKVVCQISVRGKDNKPGFWRERENGMMPVPLFFVAARESTTKVELDNEHKNLAVATLASPYDWGVILYSDKALILLRLGVAWQKDWLAVDLQVYNVYGPPLLNPPIPLVRLDGGELLSPLTPNDADKMLPDNLSFGEFTSSSSTHTATGGAQFKLLGIGVGTSYSFTSENSQGTNKGYTKVHPLRRKLFRTSWTPGPIAEGSFRGGFVLFRPPQKPITKETKTILFLHTPPLNAFVHLAYKGTPTNDTDYPVPGSAVASMRYTYSRAKAQK